MKLPSSSLRPLVALTVTVACLATLTRPVSSASILFYFGLSGHSHVSSIWSVIESLGDRGHQITLLTSIPPKSTHPAVSVVHAPEMFDAFKDTWDEGADLIQDRFDGKRISWDEVVPIGLSTCKSVFTAASSHNLVYNSSFDLVIMDTGLNECALGLAALQYNCSFMVYNALSVPPMSHDDYGMPVESSWVPEIETGRPPRTFGDRVFTTWQALKWVWTQRVNYYPKLAQIFVDHLHLAEADRPDFGELQKRTNLVLMNGHYTHGYAMSLPPLFVQIAGVSIQEKRKPLPKELADWLATTGGGDDGFIYVSFGTQVGIHKSKPELRAKFFKTFASFPNLRFVWKWDGEVPTNVPSNIFFSKWMPQQDLLAHPYVKGFITHAGMNSANEGVHFGVPMIVFPIMGDQDLNANALAEKGLGLVMEISDFSEQELRDNINTVLHDEALKSRVKKAAAVFQDRPMKPAETAVWWIEYVLRHKDTSFLMPGAVNQSWWQRRLLDVWFFVYTVILVSLSTGIYVTWKVYTCITGTRIGKKHRDSNSKPTRAHDVNYNHSKLKSN